MKIAAVVPALLVLVSLCGSPVPHPPGTISGVTVYDVNRNGIHDDCDKQLQLASVTATDADGTTQTATSGTDGTFQIKEVHPGATRVALTAPDGEVWRSTTETSDGTPGAVVNVTELKDTSGVELLATSPSPMSTTQISVSGIVFNDANGNGVVDKDECGIQDASAYVSSFDKGDVFNGGAVSDDGTFFFYGLSSPGQVYVNLPAPGWVSTALAGDPCSSGITPTAWQGTTLYEATVGFKQGTSTTNFVGTFYNDANKNGKRDPGEAGVSGIDASLQPEGPTCGGFSGGNATSDADGSFTLIGMQSGRYRLYVGINPNSDPRQPVSQITTLENPDQLFDANATADIPVLVQPAAYLNATFFVDNDGDGKPDTDYTGQSGVYGCLTTGDTIPDVKGGIGGDYPQPGECAGADPYGNALFGPVPEGVYSLYLFGAYGLPSTPTLTGIHLTAGDPVVINVPITVPTPSPPPPTPVPTPTIDPKTQLFEGGTAQTLDICFEDPHFIPPSFDDGYNGAQPIYRSWNLTEDQARAIYSVGVYAPGTGDQEDPAVWSNIAGLGWTIPPPCTSPGGGSYGLGGDNRPVFDLVQLEPLSVTATPDVTEIVVQPHDTGLWSVAIDPPSTDASEKVVLIVDGSNNVIARCDAGLGCERFQ